MLSHSPVDVVARGVQDEASEARAARMEVETTLQALQELLDSDLRLRQRELQESLTVLAVDADECVSCGCYSSLQCCCAGCRV